MTDKEETLSMMIRVLVIIGMIMSILWVIIITATIISTERETKTASTRINWIEKYDIQ